MREIIVDKETGFVDLTFEIVACNKHSIDSSRMEYDVWAKGLYAGKVIGFGLLLSATKRLFQPLKIGLGINSLGEESDNLLHALAALYGEAISKHARMKQYVPADFFVLSNPKNKKHCFDAMKIDLKMFFGNTGDNQYYCEHYLNVDLPNKVIEFHEKDEAYRRNIIKCFTF